jgi:hypothetical protein
MNDSMIQYGPIGDSIEIKNILNFIFKTNLKIVDATEKPTPVCIWGTHGLGKTQMVRDYAKEKG